MNARRSDSILCFGEVLVRLSAPAGFRLSNAAHISLHCGGAEANVGAMLAQLGHSTEMATVLPNSPLGDLCEADLRRAGLGTSASPRSDGRLGLYFFESAANGRVVYDRTPSAFSESADLFDWPALAADTTWFHLSGINLALGGKPAAAAITAVEAMRAAGATVSFDINHRASLWQGRPDADVSLVRQVASSSNVLFASASDISHLLDRELPNASDDDRRSASLQAFETFDSLRVIASTRRSLAKERHNLSARADTREDCHETKEAVIGPIIDRIGSGDAFAGAIIDGLLREAPIEECARNGLAAAVMKHGIAGDHWIGNRDDLDQFDPSTPGDIRR